MKKHCPAKSKPRPKPKPCCECRTWFTPSPKLRGRQRACSPECSAKLEKRRQAEWRRRNPGYAVQRRADADVARLEQAYAEGAGDGAMCRVLGPAPAYYARVPWEVAKTPMGAQGLVLIAKFGRLLDHHAKTVMREHLHEIESELDGLRRDVAKTPIAAPTPAIQASG